MHSHGYSLTAQRYGELVICPAALLEFVAGTHFGRSGGTKLTDSDRNSAPSLFKLLKLTGLVETLNFGALTWTPNERSPALEALLDRLSIPGGAQRMLASEVGSLRELYIPTFSILATLDTYSPAVNHLASPAEAASHTDGAQEASTTPEAQTQ